MKKKTRKTKRKFMATAINPRPIARTGVVKKWYAVTDNDVKSVPVLSVTKALVVVDSKDGGPLRVKRAPDMWFPTRKKAIDQLIATKSQAVKTARDAALYAEVELQQTIDVYRPKKAKK